MGNEAKAWRCLVCGYIHYGDEPPDSCPVCGVERENFEAVALEAPAEARATSAGRIVIAGAGIAGLSAAEAVREAAPNTEIVLLSAETDLPYYRLNLTRFLAGEIEASGLPIHPHEWYVQNRFDLRTGRKLERIEPADKSVLLDDETRLEYDKLIITTGAHAVVPSLPGSELPHVFTLRTAEDAKMILNHLEPGMSVAGIGGGILGLETAGALARQGAKVTLLEAFDYLMPRQLTAGGSERLAHHLYKLGIDVITQAQADTITAGHLHLKDGTILPADLVIIAVGVRSNCAILKEAGLAVNRGVAVDHFMRTSHPDILAAGDACEHAGVMYGSWSAAQFQGKIAGMNAVGRPTAFGGIPRSHALKILGKDMFSIGTIAPPDETYTPLEEQLDDDYRMFMMHEGTLAGALLIGNLALMAACSQAIEAGTSLGPMESADQVAAALTAT
jgi:nitrite reductase (NADH) large subunit